MKKERVVVYKEFERCVDCPFCSIRTLDGKTLDESEKMTLECMLTCNYISTQTSIFIPEDCPLRWMTISKVVKLND